jgi:ankyrin repeat protein
MMNDPQSSAGLEAENARLKKELATMSARSGQADQVRQKDAELESMRSGMARLARQLDEEITKKDCIEAQSHNLERKLYDLETGAAVDLARGVKPSKVAFGDDKDGEEADPNSVPPSQVSVKLMRVVEQWMHTKDLQQALLRNAGINDIAFSTLVQVLTECNSLSVLDLGQNQLTMDSCSDLCRLVTTVPKLSFVSVAENLFSLRSIGYFMTAVMERQSKKKLTPIEVIDMENNEGLVSAINAAAPEDLIKEVTDTLANKLPSKGGAELVAQTMRALWRFLHYTEHPQVVDKSEDIVAFDTMDKVTLRKMENALCKIMLMSEGCADGTTRTVHANMILLSLQLGGGMDTEPLATTDGEACAPATQAMTGSAKPADKNQQAQGGYVAAQMMDAGRQDRSQDISAKAESTQRPGQRTAELHDPFADLKTAFEPPKEKLKTFNLKQIVTRSGQVLMNMLERLLETTEIDARDVETDQTLLEYACQTGNMGLAKLCYRRGANLSCITKQGKSYMNIVTQNKRYDLMEFLHTYGVRINHQDKEGRTALMVAAANDDLDAICRLLEWGADVNLCDFKKRSPLHLAARKGNMQATMLLLEVGADMNAKDEKEYTAVAHAEHFNHFALMDRLVELGGKGHGLSSGSKNTTASSKKQLGDLSVTAATLKSSSLGRIGKVAVKGMSGQIQPRAMK